MQRKSSGLFHLYTACFCDVIASDDLFILRAILENSPNLLHCSDPNGSNLLHLAAKCGSENVLRYLLTLLDINAINKQSKRGITPLMWAAHKGHLGCVKALLSVPDINICAVNNKFHSALSLAANDTIRGMLTVLGPIWNDHVDELNTILMQHPQLINYVSEYGYTLLNYAEHFKSENVLRMLRGLMPANPVYTPASHLTVTLFSMPRNTPISEACNYIKPLSR